MGQKGDATCGESETTQYLLASAEALARTPGGHSAHLSDTRWIICVKYAREGATYAVLLQENFL